MLHDLDEALRRLLIREIPINNGEVDIKFDQPKREWSARLSKPTLNLFLYDIRENVRLRGSEQWLVQRQRDGTVTQRRNPVRMDVNYLLTAWTNEPDDEHRLLTRSLMALFRYANLPEDLVPDSLKTQPVPIMMQVAQSDVLANPSDLWNVLDNELRPAVVVTTTLVLDPYTPIVSPLVRTREVRFGQVDAPEVRQELNAVAGSSDYMALGGRINTKYPLDSLRIVLVERNQEIELGADGEFTLGKLRAGEYHIQVSSDGQVLKQFTLTVPELAALGSMQLSKTYDFDL